MKALLAVAAVLAAIAATAPAALGNGKPQGYTLITDTLGGNGHPKQAHTYGYRFITDTLAPGGGTSQIDAASPSSFSWGAAGVGAGATVGALLVLAGGTLLVLRRHGRILA